MAGKRERSSKDPLDLRKKIGAREETVVEKLNQMQIEDERGKVCDLIRSRDELDDKRKSVNADFKARLSDVDARIKASLSAVQTGRREVPVIVEEWLTESNEIVRIRTDTGEQIGRRTARAEELQEELFADPAPDGDAADEFGAGPG